MLKNLLLLSGFSTFVVIIIIGLDIYHGYTLSSLPATTQKHVESIVPNFDKKTLNELKKRVPIQVSLQDKSTVVSDDSKETQTTPSPTPSTPQSNSATASANIAIPIAPLQP